MGSQARAEDKFSQISEWQRNISDEPPAEDFSTATELYHASISLLRSIFKAVEDELPQKRVTRLRRILGYLKLWGHDHGAFDGSLDRCLRSSRRTRTAIIPLLRSFSHILVSRLVIYTVANVQRHVDSAYTERIPELISIIDQQIEEDTTATTPLVDAELVVYDEEDSIDDITDDLHTDMECLMGLAPLILTPVPDAKVEDSKEKTVEGSYEDFQPYVTSILKKYPQAAIELGNKLGAANLDRYIRLQVARNIAQNDAESAIRSRGDGASTVITASKFHDSGLGTSRQALSEYAISMVSTAASITSRDRPQIPPSSDAARQGELFNCDACGRSIRVTRTREWRKHIMADLQPYLCPLQGCVSDQTIYLHRVEFDSHLRSEHHLSESSPYISCPLCARQTGDGLTAISAHLARHLEDISLASLPPKVDSDVDSDTVSRRPDEFSSEDVLSISADSNRPTMPPVLGTPSSKSPTLGKVTLSLENEPPDRMPPLRKPDVEHDKVVDGFLDERNEAKTHRSLTTSIDPPYVASDVSGSSTPISPEAYTSVHAFEPSITTKKGLALPPSNQEPADVTSQDSGLFEPMPRRKSRCSSDPGDGTGCTNCKRAGAVDSCRFHLTFNNPHNSEIGLPEAEDDSDEGMHMLMQSTHNPSAERYEKVDVDSGASQFHCGICGITFAGEYAKGNYGRHMKHHDVQYSCRGSCGKRFKRTDARLKHERKHHPGLGLEPPRRKQ